ncbi:MAG: aminopeptidase P family protein [Ignavibacteriaceae bacterium]|nr:aminopeptidase P family protein [Ignavibacteriaceae bacterium]
MSAKILKEKIQQAVEILKEKNIDMWLTFVRESSITADPVMDMIVGEGCTWQSAFIICKDGDTYAIIGSLEKDKYEKNGLYKNVIGYLKSVREPLVETISKKNPQKIAINYSKNSVLADGLTYGMYQILLEHLEGTDYPNRFVNSEEIISALRGRKSSTEISIMKEAIKETLKIFDSVTRFIKPGVSEIQIADYVKKLVKKKGFELAWDEDHCPAVFTGPDTQGAHSGPTNKKVKPGHILSMDFGIKYKGYCSDLQRTWYVLKKGEKKAPPEVEKGFNTIRDSIQMVADQLKPGVKGCDMDEVARNHILAQGYDEYPHGLGHQVGKQVHDGGAGLYPRWERYGNAPYLPLEENQVFTIEPRLLVKEFGTSTVEEEVIITKDGCKFLSKPQKKLMLIKR